MKRRNLIATFGIVALLFVAGCQGTADNGGDGNSGNTGGGGGAEVTTTGELPVFRHAVSEYPSWSSYMVAAKMGLINPAVGGEHGTLEKKHGVDVELKVADYDPTLGYYGNGVVDSVCITNGDILSQSLTRKGVAILPTSRSHGADQILASDGSTTLKELADNKTAIYLLTASVSHTTIWDCAEAAGVDPKTLNIQHLDPGAAATAIQNPDGQVKAICVWNPYALQAKKAVPSLKVVDSSASTPGRVVDMVVVGQDSLAKKGGEDFARLLCEAFYTVSDAIENQGTRKDTVVALGEDFFSLGYDDMAKCLEETHYYKTGTDGVTLFESDAFQTDVMPKVVATQVAIGNIEAGKEPTLSFDGSDANVQFTTKFMK